MAFQFSVSEMIDQVKYCPKVLSKVLVLENKEWRTWPDRTRALHYREEESALQDARTLKEEGVFSDAMVIRLTTVFFSDRETRELSELTEFVALLV